MLLSIIIPIYNEEGNINLLHNRLNTALQDLHCEKEYVFINDGSKDRSLQLIKELVKIDQRVKYIDFSRNFGHQIAVSAGLDYCQGDAAVIIDADLQDPPELIPEMYDLWQKDYQVVYAKRNSRKGESYFKLLTAKMFYRILASITNIDIPLDTGDFRLIDRKIIDLLAKMPERNKYLRGQISWLGFNQTFVTYDRDERHAGTTGYPLSKMLRFAIDGMTSFSDVPLKLVTFFGFACSILASIVIAYSLYAKYMWEDTVPGWASLMVSVLFLGGIQMIALGVLGEYISRIISNVRQRPIYVVSETNASK